MLWNNTAFYNFISRNLVLCCVRSLREKCPHSAFFWSVFPRIRTEFGEILRIRENTDQKKTPYLDTFYAMCDIILSYDLKLRPWFILSDMILYCILWKNIEFYDFILRNISLFIVRVLPSNFSYKLVGNKIAEAEG